MTLPLLENNKYNFWLEISMMQFGNGGEGGTILYVTENVLLNSLNPQAFV